MKRTITILALAIVAMFALTGCGGSSGGDEGSNGTSGADARAGAQGGRGGFPGGSGKVVEVDGSTAQVQNDSGQVAVSWTDDTAFTRQVDGSATDVRVGGCVMVQPAAADSASTDSVVAGTVNIMTAQDGDCAMGGFGGRPDGAPRSGPQQGGERPEGDRPEPPDGQTSPRTGDDRARVGRGAFGTVTKVTGNGFVVESTRPGAESEATSVDVTTNADTSYTTTASAKASDVKAGVCIVAQGESDDTGAIAAKTVAISAAVDGACASMFGGVGPDRQGGAA